MDERVLEEVEALEAILMDDIVIRRENDVPKSIEYVVHPSTGNDTNQQFVCLTIEVILTPEYPDKSPEVKLKNPRGLDDDNYELITKQVKGLLKNCIGSPVIYELIELIRTNLTASNLPSGQCAICLFNFTKGDAFIKTQCYHYFHSYCLVCHLDAGKNNYLEELDKLPSWQRLQAPQYQPTCPVCRSAVTCDVEALRSAPPSKESDAAAPFSLTAELKMLQCKMAALLARQTANGGTVDSIINSPLTITTPGSNDEAPRDPAPPVPTSQPQERVPVVKPDVNGRNRSKKAPAAPAEAPSNNNATNSGAKGPYRGFNRRSAPGRRPNYNGSGRSTQPSPSNTR